MSKPICWMIAGPNGAGKTTFALKYLPEVAGCQNFVNADLIAAGLSPLEPGRELVAAGRLFLKEMSSYIAKRESFGFETTLAGRGYLRKVRQMMSEGWEVNLIYLALPDVELSILRVAERVAHGGHFVAEDIIRRRYPRSLRNLFECYTQTVSSTRCLMNSSDIPEPVFVQGLERREIQNQAAYNLLMSKVKP